MKKLNSERIWKEECGGRCAILHSERCPRYENGECKFPETRKAKEIVEGARRIKKRICEVCEKEIDTEKEMYQLHTINDLTKGIKKILGARCKKHLILGAEVKNKKMSEENRKKESEVEGAIGAIYYFVAGFLSFFLFLVILSV